MNKINIAISCAGSGIGQSIIDSCKLSDLPLVTFGLDNNPLAYGLFDCDHIILTPKVDSKNYIEKIIDICLRQNIKIIIPGIDDEVLLFSRNLKKFNKEGIEVIISDKHLLNLCRDKALTTEKLNQVAHIFVKSFSNKKEFLNALDKKEVSYPVIAKPSGGSASDSVYIIFNNSDLEKITKKHIIQEIARPHKDDINFELFQKLISKKINPQVSEISIQLVASKDGNIIGKMASFNCLKKGVPTEIIPYKNSTIWDEIDKLIPHLKTLGLKGPLNLQGRITDDGLKIFEINVRFTGITGLRAIMGFNEVEACIKSWLDLPKKDNILQLNHCVFGVRQFKNKVIYIDRNKDVQNLFFQLNKSNTVSNKKILITGATGFLGRNLITKLLNQNTSFTIIALVRDKEQAKLLLPKKIQIFDEDDLEMGKLSFGNIDVLLHLGFSRPHKGHMEIAQSLAFTGKIFRRAITNQVGNIINISSQGVYGQNCLPPWHEEKTKAAPNTPYSSAKYSTEIMLTEISHQHKQIHATSLRLAGIVGGAKGLVNIDLVSKFVQNVKNEKNIKVIGGMQEIERLDIRDAVVGIISLLKTPSHNWKSVYNLGSNKPIKLLDLAQEIIKIGKIYKVDNPSKIDFEEKEIDLKFGMDSTLFINDTGWKPEYSIQDTIHSLFNYDY
jgi:nucleoside-diphosphate-sugar epimerase/carbamoylphosphate synthase large subunit